MTSARVLLFIVYGVPALVILSHWLMDAAHLH